MTGAGEHVEPLPGATPPLMVVPLDAELSTPAVYRGLRRALRAARRLERRPPRRIRAGELPRVNDLEAAATRSARRSSPALEALRDGRRRGTRWSAAPARPSSASPTTRTCCRAPAARLPAGRRAHEVDLARRRRGARGLAGRAPPQAEALVPGRSSSSSIAVAVLIGVGVIHLPNFEKLLEDAGQALGKWTYLVVGALAFLETGAFLGLHRPRRDRGARRRARRRPGADQPVRADRDRLGLLPRR